MHQLDSASLGAVLKTALDAVVVMSMDGQIVGWNDVAERTFGWSFAQAQGARMSEMIIPEKYREAHERGLEHYLRTGDGPVMDRHIEIEALHRSGREFPIELSITRTEQFGDPVFLGFIRDISERKDAERRQELMIGELNHRVKNLLGVVSAIAHQTARSSASLDGFATAFNGRLVSLGRAYEILTAATWQHGSLRELTEVIFAPFKGARDRVIIHGDDLLLRPKQLLAVSMIFHELLTNAAKYGALSRNDGELRLGWTFADGRLAIRWDEFGVTELKQPTHAGFGSTMIARMIRHELKGETAMDWRENGLSFVVHFDVKDVAE